MSQIIIFWCINVACTIMANLTLLVFILSKRKLLTASNIFLMSELLAGLLFGVLYILPRNVLKVTFDELVICKIFTYLGVLFVICINLHVCAISFDRFFAVILPFRYRQIASKRLSLLICGIIWFISLLVCIIPIITFDRETDICLSRPRYVNATNATVPTALTPNVTTTQSVSITTSSATLSPAQVLISSWRIYLLFVLFVLFLLPLTVLVITYGTMLFVVFTHAKKVHSLTVGNTDKPKSLIVQNRKALLQVALIIGIFLILFTPYVFAQIVYLINDLKFASRAIAEFSFIVQLIAFTYPAINPFLYAYFNKDISNEIVQSCRRKSTDDILSTGTRLTTEKTTTT